MEQGTETFTLKSFTGVQITYEKIEPKKDLTYGEYLKNEIEYLKETIHSLVHTKAFLDAKLRDLERIQDERLRDSQ